ncbi:MAG: WD40/YVTN/BNR-like repeat-containing protein, partial [Stenotrophobium sp.]
IRRCAARLTLLAALLAAGGAWAQDGGNGMPPPKDADQPLPALPAAKAAQNRLTGITLAGKRLVAIGQEGVVLWSDDGQHWTQSMVPVSGMLDRVRFFDANNGWILGYDGIIMQTTDGGEHWTLRNFKAGAHPLYDLIFLDPQHAIAVGGFGDYLTSADGGKTWAMQQNPLNDLGMHMNAIIRLGDGSLFIAGERGLMARSSDNGANWALLDSPYTGSFFDAIPQGEHGVLVYGLRGNVYVSANVAACATMDYAKWDVFSRTTVADPAKVAALGWKHLDNPLTESLFGGVLLPNDKILMVGVNGTVETVQNPLSQPDAHVVPLNTSADDTLGDVAAFNGRMIAVGRQGVKDLAPLP